MQGRPFRNLLVNVYVMPLVHSEIIASNCPLLVWKLTETLDELHELLPIYCENDELASISHPQKKREWLAGRLVIKYLLEKEGHIFMGLRKDEHGKPFLLNYDFFISVTHTAEYVAAVLSPQKVIGIDMEKKHEKLLRTFPRFMSKGELRPDPQQLALLCMYWCGKEAMFKLNGRKKVSFQKDISLEPLTAESITGTARLHDDGQTISAGLHFRWIDDYCLAIAV